MTKKQHISREREKELTLLAQEGNTAARNELVMAHYPFVVWLAARFAGRGASTDEMIQNGVLGLIEAIGRSDTTLGTRLLTIAYWPIRRGITQAITDAKMVSPDGAYGRPVRYSLDNKVPDELRNQRLVSLDMVIGEEEMQTLGSTIADENAQDPADVVEEAESVDNVQKALRRMKKRTRQIVQMRLGKGKKPGQSFVQIAEHFGISRERCRRVYIRAIREVREQCEEKPTED